MRGINCKALWIKALYKCSPFTSNISSKIMGINVELVHPLLL
uniref:Uncharacterized protein n=1 Tax=Anguilla anguilla TaxID=7936 RepID=A0A0E9XWA7_ANGAN